MTTIPYDMYQSQYEVIIYIPLGGVKKESLKLQVFEEKIIISGKREKPTIRQDFVTIINKCFWGDINCTIDLPPKIIYKKIHSTLSKENILCIILPKNNLPIQKSLDIVIEN